ncbi:MAG: hypothetical protein ACI4IS_00565 [Acutalibacteraceae bacterium]
MRKLNNMTRAVILLAICVLSIAAISFSWLSRPQVIENDEQNFGKLLLSSEISAAGTTNTSTSQIKAYTRMKDGSKLSDGTDAVTATTYSATINAETGKYEQGAELSTGEQVIVKANDCTYFITELKNNDTIPTRVSLKIPVLSDLSELAMYSYAPYKDKAETYIVKNIEVINDAKSVVVKWYIANSADADKTISLTSLPAVEYFK